MGKLERYATSGLLIGPQLDEGVAGPQGEPSDELVTERGESRELTGLLSAAVVCGWELIDAAKLASVRGRGH